jgi:protein subunit release factor B
MNPFGVSENKARALHERLRRLGVREQDLEERFIRSSGPGGQHVNKVSTCVRLKHAASGVEVKVSRERSRAINRYLARVRLCERIEAALLGALAEEKKRREKIRRRKRRRTRRAREKMLEAKRRQAQKKNLRRRPVRED